MDDGSTSMRRWLPQPNLDLIGETLARYTPSDRRAARAAIKLLDAQVVETLRYTAPYTHWQAVHHIGDFYIAFIAGAEEFDITMISKEEIGINSPGSMSTFRDDQLMIFPVPNGPTPPQFPKHYRVGRVDILRAASATPGTGSADRAVGGGTTGSPVAPVAGVPDPAVKANGKIGTAKAIPPGRVSALLGFVRDIRRGAPKGCWRATGLSTLIALIAQRNIVAVDRRVASLFASDGSPRITETSLTARELRDIISAPAFYWSKESSDVPEHVRDWPDRDRAGSALGGAAYAANDGDVRLTDNLVSVAAMRKDLGDILNRAHYADEMVTIAKRERPFVAVISEKESRNLQGIRALAMKLDMKTATLVDRLQSVDGQALRDLLDVE